MNEDQVKKVKEEIDQWFKDHFHNQADPLSSQLYNKAFEVTEDLKARVDGLLEVNKKK